jgi:hypothetical protein
MWESMKLALVLRCKLTILPDDGGSNRLWNVGKLLLHCTAEHSRRRPSPYTKPWEPQITTVYFAHRMCEFLQILRTNSDYWVRFQVLTAASVKMAVFRYIAPYSPVYIYQTTQRNNPANRHLLTDYCSLNSIDQLISVMKTRSFVVRTKF